MRYHSAFQLEGRVGTVVRGAFVGLALFIPAFRDVDGAQAGDGLDGSEEVVQDIAPVAEHVNDNASAVFLAVVPTGALASDCIAFEHPIAELATDRQNLAEEAGLLQRLQFEQAGEPELVLHYAVLDTGFFGASMQI